MTKPETDLAGGGAGLDFGPQIDLAPGPKHGLDRLTVIVLAQNLRAAEAMLTKQPHHRLHLGRTLDVPDRTFVAEDLQRASDLDAIKSRLPHRPQLVAGLGLGMDRPEAGELEAHPRAQAELFDLREQLAQKLEDAIHGGLRLLAEGLLARLAIGAGRRRLALAQPGLLLELVQQTHGHPRASRVSPRAGQPWQDRARPGLTLRMGSPTVARVEILFRQ
ncbi:MAG: hypothetical protein RML12_10130 [Xanthomonadales bacterium]|nr:hypothetical protein [Xanthomonadales bacterium]